MSPVTRRRSLVEDSKVLSWILRHEPEAVGLVLQPGGWVEVDALLAACTRRGHEIDRARLEQLVSTSDKQRFAFDEGRTRIRAQQGHSTEVAPSYPPTPPPDLLFHGTVARFVSGIAERGLVPMQRHAVHLCQDRETAERVASRRGDPLVLTVRAGAMAADGHVFSRTPNAVWLVAAVPAEFIGFPAGA